MTRPLRSALLNPLIRMGLPALLLLVALGGRDARSQAREAPPAPAEDLLTQFRKELSRRLKTVDDRDRAARAACEKLRPESRFLNPGKGHDLPPGPSPERVEALENEVGLLSRIVGNLRRLGEIAVERERIVQDAHTALRAAIAKRRSTRQPARGPLARSDPLLTRLRAYEPELQKRSLAASQKAVDAAAELRAFLGTQRIAEASFRAADKAWKAEQGRRTATREKEKKAQLAERKKLAERWTRLVKERDALARDRAETEARLRSALEPAAEPDAPRPLDDLIRNVCARGALNTALGARSELEKLAVRECRNLEAVAGFHRDWGRYLEACRRAGVRLPVVPGLDPEESRQAAIDAGLAARERAAEPARIAQENARTREVIELLEAEAESIASHLLRPPDLGGLFPRPPARRRLSIPSLPNQPTDAMRAAHREATAAEHRRAEIGDRLSTRRVEARRLIRTAVARAREAGRLSDRAPTFGKLRGEITAARDRLTETATRYRALLEEERRSVLDLEARCADLERLIAGHRVEDRTTFRWRLENEWLATVRRGASRLPGTGTLLLATGVLLALGLLAGRVRRWRRWFALVQGLCFLAALALAGVGAVRSGPAAQGLLLGGAVAAAILAWAVPVNFIAGLRLLWSGRGRAGDLIWNDQVKGRVARRGPFRSLLDVSESEGNATWAWVGNRLLVRSHRPAPTPPAASPSRPEPLSRTAASPPPRQERGLHVHISLESDWMASRQLLELVARRHDERAEVRFEVHPNWIRLTVRLRDPDADPSRLAAAALRALQAAPFARVVEGTGMRDEG